MGFVSAEKAILEKLFRFGYIGKRHCSVENVAKGFPSNEKGNIYSALENLRRQGWINLHPTGYGNQVSLNAGKILDLKQLLGYPVKRAQTSPMPAKP